jgi:hypothetical protein
MIRLIMRLYGKNKWAERNMVPKVYFIAQDLEWKLIRDYETNKSRKSDAFFDSIINKIRGKCVPVGVYPLGISISGLRVFFDRLRSGYAPYAPFDIYSSMDVVKKEREASNHFNQLWRDLANDGKFRKLCVRNEEDLYPEIKTELEFYFRMLYPRFVKHIEMGKQMIENEKPHLILLTNEYGEFEHTLVVAARLKGVPTLAVQHGVITPTHCGYIFEKENKGKVILPDMTCVYGQYHYDLLTKESIYGPEQVVVTGQPRYDILYYADKIYSKEKFLARYKVTPDHGILLWTTQCHGLSDEENARNFTTVFGVMQNNKNVTLLIKQHPGEGERYTKIIEDYLAKYKTDAILVPKNSDTYEQLFFCDLLMTKSSTTAMEAVALNKPIIVLNLSGEPDAVDYVEQGVALGVYKEDDLKPSIEKLLKDPSELAKNRDKYIERYLYKIDGKATERVAQVIKRMMSTRSRASAR